MSRALLLLALALPARAGWDSGAGALRPEFFRKVHVFRGQEQQRPPSREFPWSAVGRLELPDGAHCTAVLVGRDLILTAAHCVLKDGFVRRGTISFRAGAHGGSELAASEAKYFWWGSDRPQGYRDQDWALARLAEPLGERLGWWGYRKVNLLAEPMELQFVSYPGGIEKGSRPVLDRSCRVRGSNKGFYHHDCVSTGGSSGGPLFYFDGRGLPVIVAVHVADYGEPGQPSKIGIPYRDYEANIAVPALNFGDDIRQNR